MSVTTIECDAAMSDAVLQAARAAIKPCLTWHVESQWINSLPEKQRPLVPLLMALLDSAQAVARAISDNAHDDCQPLSKDTAGELAKQAQAISDDILGAKDASDCADWSLPSMTNKELV